MPPRSKPVLIWLLATQVVYLLSLLPWVVMAGLAFMAFDAPGSTARLMPWLFAGSIWAYPILPLASSIAAWLLYSRGRTRGAAIVTTLPIVVVLVIACVLGLAGVLW